MWEALLVMAAGALAKYAANEQAVSRQKKLQSAMESYQRGKAKEGEAVVEEHIQKQRPDNRTDELTKLVADREQSMRDSVGAAQALSTATPTAGKMSADYGAAQEKSAESVAARTKRAIEQLAVMQAPADRRVQQGIRYGRDAGKIDSLNNAIESVGRGYITDIKNVRPNPFVTMAGDIAMGVGSGMAAGAGTGVAGGAAGGANSGAFADAADNLYDPNNYANAQAAQQAARRAQLNRTFGIWASR